MRREEKGGGKKEKPTGQAPKPAIKMQSKTDINMEPWGTPLVLINTFNCLTAYCYLLHCAVYTTIIPLGDRHTTNLPLK